jgi:hypothetical protein
LERGGGMNREGVDGLIELMGINKEDNREGVSLI